MSWQSQIDIRSPLDVLRGASRQSYPVVFGYGGASGSDFERCPLLWVVRMGVDVAVEKRRRGAYISVRIYGSLAATPPMRK